MNTMIPNPSRKVVVNSNIEHVKTALNKMKDFCSDGSNTIVIATGSYNGTLNTYNFMSRGQITGIIDMGMNGTATVVKVDENNTEITVEIGKAVGSISDQFEAQDCTNQINQFFIALSKLLDMTDEQINSIEVCNEPKSSISASAIGIVIAALIILGIVFVL